MNSVERDLMKISRQLYPTGRAFRMPEDGFLYGLHQGLIYSEGDGYSDARSVMDAILPDNDNFTADDATDWERRLGMTVNQSTPLADRKAAIERKMAQPGTQPAKAHYLYIQRQLQAAGFNVYVHENLMPEYPSGFSYYNPADVNVSLMSETQCSDETFLGGRQLKWYLNHLAINDMDNLVDTHHEFGNSLACTFFVGAQNWGQKANVSATREDEFRQLLLSLKQTQTVAILLINYV